MKLEVVLLLIGGLSVEEIVKKLDVSSANVRWYKRELEKARFRLQSLHYDKPAKGWQKV